MSEAKAVAKPKSKPANGHGLFWKYITAMMTEKKDGVMAMSLSRASAVGWGLLLVTLIVLAVFEVINLQGKGFILYTVAGIYAGLMGIKGLKDGANILKGRSSYGPGGPGGA